MGKSAKPEEIIAKLREVEVRLSQGETIAQVVRSISVTVSSDKCKLVFAACG